MSELDQVKDYYAILGAQKDASRRDIERLYKQRATRHHPDRGGDEADMKALNEAYSVLKNETTRRQYDASRTEAAEPRFTPVSAPAARDVGIFGHCLSALLCLILGLFLLLLVRSQWIWFLWPLAILAVFVIAFGILMARSAMLAVNASLPATHLVKRHTKIQEVAFWLLVGTGAYGLYLILTLVT
jgi:hypothetical protein